MLLTSKAELIIAFSAAVTATEQLLEEVKAMHILTGPRDHLLPVISVDISASDKVYSLLLHPKHCDDFIWCALTLCKKVIC